MPSAAAPLKLKADAMQGKVTGLWDRPGTARSARWSQGARASLSLKDKMWFLWVGIRVEEMEKRLELTHSSPNSFQNVPGMFSSCEEAEINFIKG